jgi:hypothetical protein
MIWPWPDHGIEIECKLLETIGERHFAEALEPLNAATKIERRVHPAFFVARILRR